MDIVENWDVSIMYCNYVMSQLEQKVKCLNDSMMELEGMIMEGSSNEAQQLKKYEEFYNSFQEAYDLYFFLYLGHFLRSNHYDKKQTVLENHKNLLASYSIYQYKKASLDKHIVDGNNYWKHCISYLSAGSIVSF